MGVAMPLQVVCRGVFLQVWGWGGRFWGLWTIVLSFGQAGRGVA